MNYLVAALIASIAILGWLYHDANSKLVDARAGLEMARDVNEKNRQDLDRLERSANATIAIMADRGVRIDDISAAGQRAVTAIMEAKNDNATSDPSSHQDILDVPLPVSISINLNGLWSKARSGDGADSGGAALAAGQPANATGDTVTPQGTSDGKKARTVAGGNAGNGGKKRK